MNCPKCPAEPLAKRTVNAVEVDACPRCQGVWFDQSELATLLAGDLSAARAVARGEADPAANRQPARCPRDGTVLLRVVSARNSAVVVDYCPQCRGVWLDAGELAQLLAR